jgi:hypothetical protein
MMPIHPDDILIFTEVSAAMRRVAKKYNLPLKSATGFPMPKSGLADRMGDCNSNGDIRIVLRCTENGQWCDAPLSPTEIYDTAAHELAHLKYMNHGEEFLTFCEELQVAMLNQQVDHKQKVINKLIKMQACRQSEAELGNSAAAEAFAGAINRMLLDYELNPSDLDYARATDNDPVIEMRVNLSAHNIESSKVRSAWQEQLASSIARAHLCTILIRPGSNDIYFVGTKSHTLVAEYVYGTMVPAVAKMSKKAEIDYWRETGFGRGIHNKAKGYRAAWIEGFIGRIWERFAEARRAAVAESTARTGSSKETGLIRLDGALAKVQAYIDNKFSYRAARSAGALNHRCRNHTDGIAAGREAANQIVLGRRGVTSSSAPKQLGE